MEFNFETPLILRLRKIAHSKTVLWCGILFAIYPILSGCGLISSSLSNRTLESLIQIASYFVFYILPCISFFIVYISARNKDTVLPTGGFTAAGVLCALAGVFFVINSLHNFGFGTSFYVYIFYDGGWPSRFYDSDMIIIQIIGIIVLVTFVIFFLILSATFFSAASVARNNKPRKFFPILLTVISFIILAFYIFYNAKFITSDNFAFILRCFSLDPKFAMKEMFFALMEFLLPTAAMFLCGCVGIGFAKASRRIK